MTFEVTEGPEVYVERININGNVRSEDKILRRELPLHEGELLHAAEADRARQRLVNLGYFESVNVTTQPGADKTKIIVNVDVVERATGLFSIGGGYSSVDSLVGTIDLAQRNFLGRGWEVSIRIRAGAQVQQGTLSFTEPWLFDRPLSAGFDIYKNIRNYSDYKYDTTGLGLRLSHPFEEYWRWLIGYRLSRDNISDISDFASPSLQAEQGITVTSAIGLSLTRDSRDLVAAPTKGAQTALSFDFAGLGGDSKFIKVNALQTYFLPIWWGHVLGFRAEAGYGWGWSGEPLPLFERYFLGGPNSIRSFKFHGLSPVDADGFKTGGTSELLGNFEYIIPCPSASAWRPLRHRPGLWVHHPVRSFGFTQGGRWGYTMAIAVRPDPRGLRVQPRPAAGRGYRRVQLLGRLAVLGGLDETTVSCGHCSGGAPRPRRVIRRRSGAAADRGRPGPRVDKPDRVHRRAAGPGPVLGRRGGARAARAREGPACSARWRASARSWRSCATSSRRRGR